MTEHKIGKTFTFTDKRKHRHKLLTEKIPSGTSCDGCFFQETQNDCVKNRHKIGHCHSMQREDGNTIIFREVKE